MFKDLFFADIVLNTFNRPVKDMMPYQVKQTEEGYVIVANALGIAKEDIDIKIRKEFNDSFPVILISGETKLPELDDYINKMNLKISLRITEKIKSIQWSLRNGLAIINIKVEKEYKDFNIEYVDEDEKIAK